MELETNSSLSFHELLIFPELCSHETETGVFFIHEIEILLRLFTSMACLLSARKCPRIHMCVLYIRFLLSVQISMLLIREPHLHVQA